MLFISDKTHINRVKIPRNITKSEEIYTFSLKSQGTNQSYTFEVVDEGAYRDYYVFSIDFSECRGGEYEYMIGNDKGLIQIGGISHTAIEYNKQETYIEYKS